MACLEKVGEVRLRLRLGLFVPRAELLSGAGSLSALDGAHRAAAG